MVETRNKCRKTTKILTKIHQKNTKYVKKFQKKIQGNNKKFDQNSPKFTKKTPNTSKNSKKKSQIMKISVTFFQNQIKVENKPSDTIGRPFLTKKFTKS